MSANAEPRPTIGLEQIRPAFLPENRNKTSAAALAGVPEQLRRLAIFLSGLNLADFLLQMPVGRQHVQSSVQIVIEKENAEL